MDSNFFNNSNYQNFLSDGLNDEEFIDLESFNSKYFNSHSKSGSNNIIIYSENDMKSNFNSNFSQTIEKKIINISCDFNNESNSNSDENLGKGKNIFSFSCEKRIDRLQFSLGLYLRRIFNLMFTKTQLKNVILIF